METPYYLFDLKQVQKSYCELKNIMNVDRLFYAIKCNGEDEILKALNKINANFEIASVGELRKLLSLGISVKKIICSLPIKTEEMISEMYALGIRYFVFDNASEYKKIKRYAPNALKILRIYLNDFLPDTIEYGMTFIEFQNLVANHDIESKDIDGLTFYISGNKDVNNVLLALSESEKYYNVIGNNKILNIGGNYRLPEEIDRNYYTKLNEKIESLKSKYKLTVYAEPGRSVVKKAGKLVCKVIYVNYNKKYVYIDAGVPTGISYAPPIIHNLSNDNSSEIRLYTFFDITCSHRVLFSYSISFDINHGDILEFDNFGSYSICKASEFHGWGKPKCYYK